MRNAMSFEADSEKKKSKSHELCWIPFSCQIFVYLLAPLCFTTPPLHFTTLSLVLPNQPSHSFTSSQCHNNWQTVFKCMWPMLNTQQNMIHHLPSCSLLKAGCYHLFWEVRLIILGQAKELTILSCCRHITGSVIGLKVQPVWLSAYGNTKQSI